MTSSQNAVDLQAQLFETATELEAPIMDLKNRARIMFAVTGDMDDDDGMVMYQLAVDVKAATARLSEIYKRLFLMTHPHPENVAEAEEDGAEAEPVRAGEGRRTADAPHLRTIPSMPNRTGKTS